MRKKLMVVLALCIAAVAVGAAALYWIKVYPWLAAPAEPRADIDARWARVVAWSGIEELGSAEAKLLHEAIEHVKRAEGEDPDLFALLGQGWGEELAGARLQGAAQDALSRLVAWHQQGPELGPEVCGLERGIDVLALLALGRLALLRAGDEPDQEHRQAALHLAASMRRAGDMLTFAVGAELFSSAVEQAQALGIAPGAAFARYAFTAEEVFPALAREQVCTYHFVERSGAEQLRAQRGQALTKLHDLGELGREIAERMQRLDLGGAVGQRSTWERELLMYRQHFGRRLGALQPYAGDLEQLAQRSALGDVGGLPKSMLVRICAHDATRALVTTFAGHLEAYAELQARAPLLQQLGRLRTALRAWHARRGVLPETLAELRADGLAERDLLAPDGTPIAYRETVEGALLSHAGHDYPLWLAAAQQDEGEEALPATDGLPTPGALEPVAGGAYEVQRAEVRRALAQPERMASQARIVPAFQQDRAIGFKLFAIRSGSLYQRLGLEDGDVVKSVDGTPLTSPDAALEALHGIAERDQVTIEILREGQLLTMRYPLVP